MRPLTGLTGASERYLKKATHTPCRVSPIGGAPSGRAVGLFGAAGHTLCMALLGPILSLLRAGPEAGGFANAQLGDSPLGCVYYGRHWRPMP